MEAINQELTLEKMADDAIRIVNDVMDASIVLARQEPALRALVAKLADMPVPAEQEEWKRETTKIWREMADFIRDAVATLDGHPPVHNSQAKHDSRE